MCHRIVDGHANTLTHAIHYLPFVDFYFIWAHFEKAPARSRLKRNGALFSCAFILENWMGNGLSQTSTTVLSISNYPHILEKSFFLLFLVNWVNVWSVILECRAFYSKFHDCAKPFSCCCRLFVHIALFYILCYCASCLSYISFGCLFGAYKF